MTFFNIAKSEMKYQMKGIVFWLVIGLTIFFLYTQFGIYDSADLKPKINFGKTIRVNPTREIEYYSDQMNKNLEEEEITKYNIVKIEKNISKKVREEMKSILSEIEPGERGSYKEYTSKLNNLNRLLGGNTIYGEKWRSRLFKKYISPEEEMKKIKQQIETDLQRKKYINYTIGQNQVLLTSTVKNEMKRVLNKIKQSNPSGVKEYNKLLVDLNKINQLSGGNTIYGKKWRQIVVREEMYYRMKSNSLQNKVKHGITDGYGRLFSDYLGITVGFFPIFIGAFLISRDRRTGMEELIRSRKINPYFYIGGKIAGVFLLLSIFYLLLSLIPTYNFYQICMENNWAFQPFGFIKYTVGWVFPTLLFVLTSTVFISELLGSSLFAAGIQLVWLFKSMMPLKGDYSLTKYIIRFNSSGDFQLYQDAWSDILLNRFFYIGLSLFLIVFASWIWKKKNITDERGYYVFGRIFKI